MTRERAALPFDLSGVQPRQATNVVPSDELERMAADAGFVTRHAPAPVAKRETSAPQPKPAKLKLIDGRRRRKSKKTTQLNIAVEPEDKNRFWDLADKLELESGGDVLGYLLDLAEQAGQGD
ncbi:hypothetical protein ACRRRS_21835 (plasmid) [Brucella anthropi]|uniref:hypothetical protein n=1 Tax=Brucella anthropi TaxID=529 RepID=UPI003D7D766D